MLPLPSQLNLAHTERYLTDSHTLYMQHKLQCFRMVRHFSHGLTHTQTTRTHKHTHTHSLFIRTVFVHIVSRKLWYSPLWLWDADAVNCWAGSSAFNPESTRIGEGLLLKWVFLVRPGRVSFLSHQTQPFCLCDVVCPRPSYFFVTTVGGITRREATVFVVIVVSPYSIWHKQRKGIVAIFVNCGGSAAHIQVLGRFWNSFGFISRANEMATANILRATPKRFGEMENGRVLRQLMLELHNESNLGL